MDKKKLSKKQVNALVGELGKDLKQMEERLAEQQKPINEKMEKMQGFMDKMEKIWKIPVDYNELLAIAKKINAQHGSAK